MPELIAQVTLKSGGEYHPPGSVVTIDNPDEAEQLVERGHASWAGEDSDPWDDFPGRSALEDAGLGSVDQVRALYAEGGEDALLAIDGIGPATATSIVEALES